MSATARFRVLYSRLEHLFLRWLGINGNPGALSYSIQMDAISENKTPVHQPSILENIFDSRLWAVPKFRRSLERRQSRKMGGKGHFETYGLPKRNIVSCLECGSWHESHTICGNCYSKVKEETNLMKEAMGEEANFYAPQKEVAFVYSGEDIKSEKDKFVVDMKKDRPTWFSNSLLSKLPESHGS